MREWLLKISRYKVEFVRIRDTMSFSSRFCTLIALLSASALGTTFLLGVPGADAASPSYCSGERRLHVSPALSTSGSIDAVAAAPLRLPGDISAPHGDDVKLLAATSLSSSAVSSDIVRSATSDVALETAAFTSTINQELNVVINSSSTTLMRLAREFVIASNAAASANAHISADRSGRSELAPDARLVGR
jgi:hypothetical protein